MLSNDGLDVSLLQSVSAFLFSLQDQADALGPFPVPGLGVVGLSRHQLFEVSTRTEAL